jgi:multiple sugar transport system substrate-binding protein
MSRIYSGYNRRQVVQFGLGGLTTLALAACGGTTSTGSSDAVKLNLYFWGSASRDKLTKKATDDFHTAHSNVTISRQFYAFDAYWEKLNTQIAGGTLPDLIQMDMRYLKQYSDKSLLTDLTPYADKKTIDLGDFNTALLDASKYAGKINGIPLGSNFHCMIYDTETLKELGIVAPTEDLTWEKFGTYAASFAQKSSDKVYGTQDMSGEISTFEIWLRQFGKEVYTDAGQAGFTVDDVKNWFTYWDGLRKAKACVPASVQASNSGIGNPATSAVIAKLCAFAFAHSNQYESYQAVTKRQLAMHHVPDGTGPGSYLKPSMLMSVSSKTKNADTAAQFINFIINDAKGVSDLSLDRGIPGSKQALASLTAGLTPAQKIVIDFYDGFATGTRIRAKKVLDPAGAGDVGTALLNSSQEVGFGRSSVADQASKFMEAANKALK